MHKGSWRQSVIVEGYELHLYCDGGGCENYSPVPDVNARSAFAGARHMGWLFVHRDGHAHWCYCKDCRGEYDAHLKRRRNGEDG